MPKNPLLEHYRGPEPHRPLPPIGKSGPEEVEARVAFRTQVMA